MIYMKRIIITTIIISILLTIIGCNNGKTYSDEDLTNEIINTKWLYEDDGGFETQYFLEDGTVKRYFSDMKEEGTWSVDGENIIVLLDGYGDEKFEYNYKKDKLIYKFPDSTYLMEFIKVTSTGSELEDTQWSITANDKSLLYRFMKDGKSSITDENGETTNGEWEFFDSYIFIITDKVQMLECSNGNIISGDSKVIVEKK